VEEVGTWPAAIRDFRQVLARVAMSRGTHIETSANASLLAVETTLKGVS
jgi:hypothetical protein